MSFASHWEAHEVLPTKGSERKAGTKGTACGVGPATRPQAVWPGAASDLMLQSWSACLQDDVWPTSCSADSVRRHMWKGESLSFLKMSWGTEKSYGTGKCRERAYSVTSDWSQVGSRHLGQSTQRHHSHAASPLARSSAGTRLWVVGAQGTLKGSCHGIWEMRKADDTRHFSSHWLQYSRKIKGKIGKATLLHKSVTFTCQLG